MCVSVHLCVYTYIYIYMPVYKYVYICMYRYLYIYVCIYMYKYHVCTYYARTLKLMPKKPQPNAVSMQPANPSS